MKNRDTNGRKKIWTKLEPTKKDVNVTEEAHSNMLKSSLITRLITSKTIKHFSMLSLDEIWTKIPRSADMNKSKNNEMVTKRIQT